MNRDLFNSKQEWRQEPNPDGPSDKTLAVVAFVGEDAWMLIILRAKMFFRAMMTVPT